MLAGILPYHSLLQILLHGVGLSGMLSPLLFAVYMDVLINRLQNAAYGCKLVQRFVGCLSVICHRR